MRVTISFTLEDSPYPVGEAETRIQAGIEMYHIKGFSELLVDLLRVLKAKTWGDLTVEVKE